MPAYICTNNNYHNFDQFINTSSFKYALRRINIISGVLEKEYLTLVQLLIFQHLQSLHTSPKQYY